MVLFVPSYAHFDRASVPELQRHHVGEDTGRSFGLRKGRRDQKPIAFNAVKFGDYLTELTDEPAHPPIEVDHHSLLYSDSGALKSPAK